MDLKDKTKVIRATGAHLKAYNEDFSSGENNNEDAVVTPKFEVRCNVYVHFYFVN